MQKRGLFGGCYEHMASSMATHFRLKSQCRGHDLVQDHASLIKFYSWDKAKRRLVCAGASQALFWCHNDRDCKTCVCRLQLGLFLITKAKKDWQKSLEMLSIEN